MCTLKFMDEKLFKSLKPSTFFQVKRYSDELFIKIKDVPLQGETLNAVNVQTGGMMHVGDEVFVIELYSPIIMIHN